MKRQVVGLLLVAVGLLVAGCGDARSTSTSPSPNPSPSPTVLTKANLLTQFLADLKPIRVRYRKLENRLDHIIYEGAHNTLDSTWPPAGRKVWKLTPKYDGIMVDLQLVNTPTFMRPAMKSLLKCLRAERQMYDSAAEWLVNKEDWSSGSSNGKKFIRLRDETVEAADAWRIAVKLEAKRLGAKIPWNWNKP